MYDNITFESVHFTFNQLQVNDTICLKQGTLVQTDCDLYQPHFPCTYNGMTFYNATHRLKFTNSYLQVDELSVYNGDCLNGDRILVASIPDAYSDMTHIFFENCY